MSTAAAIVLAAFAAMGAVWFALTRNGRHATRVIVFALHYRFVPAYGRHGKEGEPERVRDMLRGLAIAARVSARYWACTPLLWWTVWQVNRAIRQLAKEETPRAQAAAAPGEGTVPDPAPNSGTVPLPPGGTLHPYRDVTETRAERYSLRVPSYHSDPAEPVGAATGDFPRLIP